MSETALNQIDPNPLVEMAMEGASKAERDSIFGTKGELIARLKAEREARLRKLLLIPIGVMGAIIVLLCVGRIGLIEEQQSLKGERDALAAQLEQSKSDLDQLSAELVDVKEKKREVEEALLALSNSDKDSKTSPTSHQEKRNQKQD